MNLQSQVIAPARPALCPRWALGLCPYGHHCHLDHPNNLDPTMPKEVDYKVSNELGEACTRCLQGAIKVRSILLTFLHLLMLTWMQCDKQGRDSGSDDPCSECRWFGGAICNCTLLMTSSYNDALWRGMMNRRDSDFDLAQPRDKQAAFSNGRVPAPMPDDRLKSNWQGASKDELLARKNMLPPEVRRHPRAYLVPPRVKNTKKKSTAFLSRSGAHDSSRNVSISSSNTSMAPMPYGGLQQPPPPQPSAYPQGNAVVASAMHWPTGQRIQHFQSGHTVISPRQNMFPLLQNTFSAPAYGTNPTVSHLHLFFKCAKPKFAPKPKLQGGLSIDLYIKNQDVSDDGVHLRGESKVRQALSGHCTYMRIILLFDGCLQGNLGRWRVQLCLKLSVPIFKLVKTQVTDRSAVEQPASETSTSPNASHAHSQPAVNIQSYKTSTSPDAKHACYKRALAIQHRRTSPSQETAHHEHYRTIVQHPFTSQ